MVIRQANTINGKEQERKKHISLAMLKINSLNPRGHFMYYQFEYSQPRRSVHTVHFKCFIRMLEPTALTNWFL
jgi:hypothetical protein